MIKTHRFWHFSLGNVLRTTTAYTFSTCSLPRMVRDRHFFTLLTWKRASHHNRLHFFDISSSKSGPAIGNALGATTACTISGSKWSGNGVLFTFGRGNVIDNGVHFFDMLTSKSGPWRSVFYTCDLEMCFAPQRRTLFRHLKFQKCSGNGVFSAFWFGNVLCAKTAHTFSTCSLPNVVRTWKCVSRHNGVQFFDISSSKSGPGMVCFVHLTWKCASRHSGVHFFDISSSKSGPGMVCHNSARFFDISSSTKWFGNGVFCTYGLGNVLRAATACAFSTSQVPKVVREWCFLHFDLDMCFGPQQRALFRHLKYQKWSANGVFCSFGLGNVLGATAAYTFSTSQVPKVVREWCVLHIWTWKCASRRNSVRFFDISSSQSGPGMVCFLHFDLDMCFGPQQRALFRHLKFQKWSGNGVFCSFGLGNVLRATAAYTFSTSQLPKVVRTLCVLCIWFGHVLRATAARTFSISQVPKSGSGMVCFVRKCAWRHTGVQFFIPHLARWLRTRRFGEPTFRPPRTTNHWKNTVNRDFPTFSRTCIFFLLTLSLLWSSHFLASPLWLFPPLLFHLFILSEVWLLNFLRW